MKNNTRASKGFPTRPNHDRYPMTEGLPLLCSTCHVKDRCAKFEAEAICAYRKDYNKLGPSTRDPTAIAEELSKLVGAQRERVWSGMIFEHVVLGGLPDPEVGTEIERMTRLLFKLFRLRLALDVTAVNQPQADGLFAMLFPEVCSVCPMPGASP